MLSQSGQVTHLAVARTASSCLATRRPPGAAADSREGYLAVMAALFRVLADTQRGSGGDGSAPAPSAALSAVLAAVPDRSNDAAIDEADPNPIVVVEEPGTNTMMRYSHTQSDS